MFGVANSRKCFQGDEGKPFDAWRLAAATLVMLVDYAEPRITKYPRYSYHRRFCRLPHARRD